MESGVYAVLKKKIDPAKSFAFMSEYSSLFYLKIEQMNEQQFEKQFGYELWHQRIRGTTIDLNQHGFIKFHFHHSLNL